MQAGPEAPESPDTSERGTGARRSLVGVEDCRSANAIDGLIERECGWIAPMPMRAHPIVSDVEAVVAAPTAQRADRRNSSSIESLLNAARRQNVSALRLPQPSASAH